MTTTLPVNPRPWPLAADKVEGHWTQYKRHDGERMCLAGGLESCGLAPGEWVIARAVARHRDHGEQWNDTGGRTEAAILQYRRILKERPEDRAVQENLARALELQGPTRPR